MDIISLLIGFCVIQKVNVSFFEKDEVFIMSSNAVIIHSQKLLSTVEIEKKVVFV